MGEAATKVLAGRVQIGVSLVASTALRSASFEAPRGNESGSVAFPPDLGLGASAAVEVSFTSLQVNTHGQWHLGASDSPATEYLDISLSDHTSLAPLAVKDAPQPLVLLIPIDADVLANPEPGPCAASEDALGLCGVCDANDARLGRHNCSGHGPCTLPPSPTRALPLALYPYHISTPLTVTLTLTLSRCVRARAVLVRRWPHHRRSSCGGTGAGRRSCALLWPPVTLTG